MGLGIRALGVLGALRLFEGFMGLWVLGVWGFRGLGVWGWGGGWGGLGGGAEGGGGGWGGGVGGGGGLIRVYGGFRG